MVRYYGNVTIAPDNATAPLSRMWAQRCCDVVDAIPSY